MMPVQIKELLMMNVPGAVTPPKLAFINKGIFEREFV